MTFRWLVSLAAWLDKRFPPKVVVTQESYDALQEKEHRHSKELARLAGEIHVERDRVTLLEKSLAALKEGIVKGQISLNAREAAKMREEFVSGNFSRMGLPAAGEGVIEGAK